MRWPALSLLLWCACATQHAATTPIEATPVEDTVASAFEPEAVVGAPAVTAKPPPPLADLRAPLKEAVEAATRALSNKDLEAAREASARATKAAEALSAMDRVTTAELSFKVALAGGAVDDAQQTARAWRARCAGDGLDACRAAANAALLSTSRLDPSLTRGLKEEVDDVKKAESCLKASERAHKPEKCFADAEKTAKAHHDELLLSRAALVRALAAPEARQPALLATVGLRCEAPGCVAVRRRALAVLVARARAEKKPDDLARYALLDAQAFATLAAPAERTWARPPETDAACATVDATNGPGACRKLEKQLNGGWSFKDFSKDKPRDGLSADEVRTVNEHYAPLLQECLGAQARRLTPPDAVRYEVRWMVFNDGRVGEVHFKNPAADGSELGKCLRAQFELWRYPRYEGEWQHVEQAFTVSAVERRSGR
ncbi:MAG: hypothetical protein IAE78_25575 [Myxococcus sp.]|nr:hypothetical protein [Myxococcus sp.]